MAPESTAAQISQIRISDSDTEVIDIGSIVKEEHDRNMIEISRGEGQDHIPGGVSLVIFDLSSTNDYQKADTGAFIKDYVEWQDANSERVVVFVVKNEYDDDDDDDPDDHKKIMGDVSEYAKRISDTHALYFASVDVDSLMLYCFVKRDLGHEPKHRLLLPGLQWLRDEKGNDRDDSSTCSGLIASLLSKKAAEEAGSSSEAIINSIVELDKLYATHKVNMAFTWPAEGTLSGALLEKVQNVRLEDSAWHGGLSLARILAQYAAEHELGVAHFSANVFGESTTEALLTKVTPGAVKAMDEATYLTYCIVSAIHLQNFGALFTSQPHFDSKPVDEDKYDPAYSQPRPKCWLSSRFEITLSKIDERPAQIDHKSLGRAIALINRLINGNVLIPRVPHLDAFDYQFATSLAALDQRLRDIDIGKFTATFDPQRKTELRVPLLIDMYTRGLAGGSTTYSQMRKQALMCFCAFLPMIEHKLRAEGKTGDDEIRAEAMSYACVSHGLDPKHMIAARYAMTVDVGNFTDTQAEGVLTELFAGNPKWPLTNALMRTRIFASIIVIDQVNDLYKVEKAQSYGFTRSRAYV